MKIEQIPISKLKEDSGNPNRMTKKQRQQLYESINRYGLVQPLVIDHNNMVINGNQKLLVIKMHDDLTAKYATVPCYRTSKDMSEADRLLLQQSLNKIHGEHDKAKDTQIYEILTKKNRTDDLAKLLGTKSNAINRLLDRQKATPPPPTTTTTQAAKGDLWKLGKHTLYVGNFTGQQIIDKVDIILTDPPYSSGGWQESGKSVGSVANAGGNQAYGNSPMIKNRPAVAGDQLSTSGFKTLLSAALGTVETQQAYVFTDWRMWTTLNEVLALCLLPTKMMIVWNKENVGIGTQWRNQHELIAYATKGKLTKDTGVMNQGNVISCLRTMNPHGHPTEKPLELIKTILFNTVGDTVYDPFCGTGTTILAAQDTGKTCYACEIEPKYAQITIDRFEKHTGTKAEKVKSV